jgi:hypothetical protein
MGVARLDVALLGSDESNLVTVANNATVWTGNSGTPNTGNTTNASGAERDMLGDNTSDGDMELYAVVTGSGTSGSVDIKINSRRVSGEAYSKVNFEIGIVPINGTQKIPLGRRPVSRYMNAEVKNSSTGGNVSVGIFAKVIKFS